MLPEGVADRALYLLADGRLELVRAGARGVLATLEAPATLGEAAFLDGKPRLRRGARRRRTVRSSG